MRVFLKDGELTAIYDDALLPFLDRAKQRFKTAETLRRASNVEPNTDPLRPGRWLVDLTPSGGPVYFADEQGAPFYRREDALAFERRWLETRMEAELHVGNHPQGGRDAGSDV